MIPKNIYITHETENYIFKFKEQIKKQFYIIQITKLYFMMKKENKIYKRKLS